MDRVPACRVGKTVKLGIKADFTGSISQRRADGAPGRLPCRPARSTANNTDVADDTILYLDLKLRCAEPLAIVTKTDLPWQTASGGRLQYPGVGEFFTGRDKRNIIFGTEISQVQREIRVSEKIKDKIAVERGWKVVGRIIDDRRQGSVDRDDIKLYRVACMQTYPGNFPLAAAILLKYGNALGSLCKVIHLDYPCQSTA